MFHVILHEPDIPANTGNIIRLCANSGCRLHLIEPLGFRLDRRSVRRAALDYAELAILQTHKSLAACLQQLSGVDANRRHTAVPLFAIETGEGGRLYSEARFAPGSALLFGAETRGLPDAVLAGLSGAQRLRLPMRPGNRSINLANSVAIVVYEAWRQNGFEAGFELGSSGGGEAGQAPVRAAAASNPSA